MTTGAIRSAAIALGGGDAVEDGHLHVEDHQVGPQLARPARPPSAPSPAWPTTSYPSSPSISARSIRIRASSSAITTRRTPRRRRGLAGLGSAGCVTGARLVGYGFRRSPGRVGGTADAMVSNTIVRKGVWVRIPHPAPVAWRVGGTACMGSCPTSVRSPSSTALWRPRHAGVRDAENAVLPRRRRQDDPSLAAALPAARSGARAAAPRSPCPDATARPWTAPRTPSCSGGTWGRATSPKAGARSSTCTSSTTSATWTQRAILDADARASSRRSRPHTRLHARCRRLHRVVEALAVPLPPARAGPQARAAHHARGLAGGRSSTRYPATSCAGCSTPTVHASTTGPRGWSLARSGATTTRGGSSPTGPRTSSSCAAGHSTSRGRLAPVRPVDHLGLAQGGGRPARRADRAEVAESARPR